MKTRAASSFGSVAGLVLVWFLFSLAAGCSRKPADLHRAAVQAEAQARQAFEERDFAAAERAAVHAEDALEALKSIAGRQKSPSPETARLLQDTASAAAAARNYAQLAFEEHQCRTRLRSLKVKAYKGVRDTVYSYGLGSLAPLAEQLAKADTNTVPFAQQSLASLARRLAEVASDGPPLTNGPSDWSLVAASLRSSSTNPPPKLSLFLATAFALSGFTDFSLCEIESVHPAVLVTTNSRSLYHLERGALYALQGWDRTAARELDQAMQLSPNGWNGVGTTQALAIFHLWLADHAFQRKHYPQADLEIAAAARAWPHNPLTPFLLGERLAAGGEWVKAAESLEAQAAATKDQWLAGRLTLRARQIRDAQGKTAPLFSDPAFILEIALHTVGQSAGNSAAISKVQQFFRDAQAFGARVAEKLPGL